MLQLKEASQFRASDCPKSKWRPNKYKVENSPVRPAGFLFFERYVADAPSRTGMAIPIVPEIRSAARIIRPKTTHTVGHRIARRRTVCRNTVVSGAGVIAWGVIWCCQGASDQRASDESSSHRSAPSPASSSPINGIDCARGYFGDRKRLADRSCSGTAGVLSDDSC